MKYAHNIDASTERKRGYKPFCMLQFFLVGFFRFERAVHRIAFCKKTQTVHKSPYKEKHCDLGFRRPSGWK